MSIFENKTLMITGGTGSFGNAVLNRFLATDIKEIRVFSRDEKKQDDIGIFSVTDLLHVGKHRVAKRRHRKGKAEHVV